jgi:hypothetical protein
MCAPGPVLVPMYSWRGISPYSPLKTIPKRTCCGLFANSLSSPPCLQNFGFDDRKLVTKAFDDLKMDRATAKGIVQQVARK